MFCFCIVFLRRVIPVSLDCPYFDGPFGILKRLLNKLKIKKITVNVSFLWSHRMTFTFLSRFDLHIFVIMFMTSMAVIS